MPGPQVVFMVLQDTGCRVFRESIAGCKCIRIAFLSRSSSRGTVRQPLPAADGLFRNPAISRICDPG